MSFESRVPHTRPAPSYNWIVPLHESNSFSAMTACRYLSCWSFRDGLMPRLSSVLTTSTWVSIVKSVSLDIQNKVIKAQNFISLPQWSSLSDFVWLNASKQRWSISQTPCQVQTNKQKWLSKTLPLSAVKHAGKKTKSKETKLKWLSNTLTCPNKQTKVTIEDLATERSQTRRGKKQKAKKQN